ncbi:MAG: hypothetical protein ACI8RZ_003331, partial [Myxococcota bacterium]
MNGEGTMKTSKETDTVPNLQPQDVLAYWLCEDGEPNISLWFASDEATDTEIR